MFIGWLFNTNSGLVFFSKKRTPVDYSKWLGPDWKPTYEGAGIWISNHCCYGEIVANFYLLDQIPSYVAKSSTRKLIGIGAVMGYLRCLFIEHRGKAGSLESKQAVMDQINEGQLEAE